MTRRLYRFGVLTAVVIILGLAAGSWQYVQTKQIRQALYDAFEPVQVTNCELQRFGDAHDGGYLLCGNLLDAAQVAYSYGINGVDEWGCQISEQLRVPVHQYDCFNTTVPSCNGEQANFHNECVGPRASTFEDRVFDSVANQVAKNGDTGKRVVMKMDVEGSEWESLLESPDPVLERIDQLVVEFHEVEKPEFLATVQRLKQFFQIAHIHQNNYMCEPGFEPFPGQVFEVLFVNKRLAQVDPSINARGPSPLDAPNTMAFPDCQALAPESELAKISKWFSRKRPIWYGQVVDRVMPPY